MDVALPVQSSGYSSPPFRLTPTRRRSSFETGHEGNGTTDLGYRLYTVTDNAEMTDDDSLARSLPSPTTACLFIKQTTRDSRLCNSRQTALQAEAWSESGSRVDCPDYRQSSRSPYRSRSHRSPRAPLSSMPSSGPDSSDGYWAPYGSSYPTRIVDRVRVSRWLPIRDCQESSGIPREIPPCHPERAIRLARTTSGVCSRMDCRDRSCATATRARPRRRR